VALSSIPLHGFFFHQFIWLLFTYQQPFNIHHIPQEELHALASCKQVFINITTANSAITAWET